MKGKKLLRHFGIVVFGVSSLEIKGESHKCGLLCLEVSLTVICGDQHCTVWLDGCSIHSPLATTAEPPTLCDEDIKMVEGHGLVMEENG